MKEKSLFFLVASRPSSDLRIFFTSLFKLNPSVSACSLSFLYNSPSRLCIVIDFMSLFGSKLTKMWFKINSYFAKVKWFHLVISLLFLSFAIMQWNDADAIIWIIMYIGVSGVAFLAFKDQHYVFINAGFVALLLVSLIFYIPDLMSWIDDDMPSITTSMQASSPYIELVRESLGLIISLLTMIFYLFIAKRKR